MIRNLTNIEFQGKNGKIYRFLCDEDSPLGEIFDIICQMKYVIVQKIFEAEEAQKPTAAKKVIEDNKELSECEICEVG